VDKKFLGFLLLFRKQLPELRHTFRIGALAFLIAAGLGTYLLAGAWTGALKPRTFVKDLLGR